jgi:hypothetical protein
MVMADLWGPIGAVLGLLAIIVGGVVAWWFARGPRLVMQVSGSTLVSSPSDNRIRVLYKDSPVPRVTQSLVWLWREGRGTIRGSDVVSDDPIMLKVPDGEHVLEATLLVESRPTNGVSVAPADGKPCTAVLVGFNYLDPRQGAVIEVLHTAKSPTDVEATGTIMGIPKGIARVATDVRVQMPVGLTGSVAVTVPTHTVPRSLQSASGARTVKQADLTPMGLLKTALRTLLGF